MDFKHGLIQLFIAFDQLVNVLTNPFSRETWADETISSRCGRLGHRYPYKFWKVIIDAMFLPFQGPNHCENAHKKELTRYHFPPSMRSTLQTKPASAGFFMGAPVLNPIAASPEDLRDIPYVPSGMPLPSSVDLMPWATEIEDQYSIGSCTANATTSAIELIAKRGEIDEDLSRLFLYYTSRLEESRLGQDGLQTLRSAMHAGYKVGLCLESEWPYVVTDAEKKPFDACFASASVRKVTRYERIGLGWWQKPVEQIKAALAEGLPVIIAMSVNEQIYSVTGPLAQQKYEVSKDGKRIPTIGGHAVAIIGYDDAIGGFIYANSWGKDWGDGGFGRLEYRHIGEIFEAWVIRGYRDIYINPPEMPKPEPKPEPVPVPEPTPEPEPVPEPIPPAPEPEPQPEPSPDPAPAEHSEKPDNVPKILALLLLLAVLSKAAGLW